MSSVSERDYRSIGEVLALLQEEFPDVTISKIRFLESQGLIDPERTTSGYRKFYADDVDRLRFILREQRENFLPLRVIRSRLDGGPGDIGNDVVTIDPTRPRLPFDTDALGMGVASDDAAEATAPPKGPDGATHPTTTQHSFATTGADHKAGTKHDPLPPAPPVSAPAPTPTPEPTVSPAAIETGVSLSGEELVSASGLSWADLRELEGYGLVASHSLGHATYYDEEALAVARLAAAFRGYGIEARHLRMYKHFVEREAALFEQVVTPLLKQRNPQARAQAGQTLHALADHGATLRSVLVRRALRPGEGLG